jgi:hypothetical protein
MGNPVLIAPACVGSEKLFDHFGSYVRTISPHLWKRLFLEHTTNYTKQY